MVRESGSKILRPGRPLNGSPAHELRQASAAQQLAQCVAELIGAIPAAFQASARSAVLAPPGTHPSIDRPNPDAPALPLRSRRCLSTATGRNWRSQLRQAEQRLKHMSPACVSRRDQFTHASLFPKRRPSFNAVYRLQTTMQGSAPAATLGRVAPKSSSAAAETPAAGACMGQPHWRQATAPSRPHSSRRGACLQAVEQSPRAPATRHLPSHTQELDPQLLRLPRWRRASGGALLQVCSGVGGA